MSCADRPVPSVSLVIGWPKTTPAALADQLARQLGEARLSSTWAIEEPEQAAVISSKTFKKSPVEIALRVDSSSTHAVEAIGRGLDQFHSAGQEIVAIQVGESIARGSVERRLCQAGVRSVILAPVRGKSSSVRPLPFGVWEFGPHVSAPLARAWLSLFGRSAQALTQLSEASPTIASIDLGRVGSANSSGWQSVEKLIGQAAEASRRGTARIVTIGEIAEELADLAAPRPQRSILRAAA